MDELKLGPNGGLIYCMEYLIINIKKNKNLILNISIKILKSKRYLIENSDWL